jgi:hypothetical protein
MNTRVKKAKGAEKLRVDQNSADITLVYGRVKHDGCLYVDDSAGKGKDRISNVLESIAEVEVPLNYSDIHELIITIAKTHGTEYEEVVHGIYFVSKGSKTNISATKAPKWVRKVRLLDDSYVLENPSKVSQLLRQIFKI